MCEIWFNVTEQKPYNEIFTWLQDRDVRIGLHHWGLVEGRYKTNLMTADEAIRTETIRQIKQTIDIAADIQAVYVNIHPGAQAIERLNFEANTQGPENKASTSAELAETLLLEGARELQFYAKEKSILLTIETLPGKENTEYMAGRSRIYDPGNASLPMMEKLTVQGNFIANDLTHTTGQISKETDNTQEIWKRLFSFTQKIAPATRLIHINTVEPPYNGTDSHGGITDNDFTTERFPSKEQLQQILSLFSHRDDVYIVPEPRENTQDNFLALKVLASEDNPE
ncbi:MAG: TIM barrel protein [Candidatus Andersenbacteria bacterium]|nr:TIM barrel protein [Candidatus Andersenbacteria bacterium]